MNTITNSQENTNLENSGLPATNGISSNPPQNGQELLLQLLAAQGNLGAVNQATVNLINTQGSPQNMQLENLAQNSSQSLLLLQKIIQTTPEIQLLHQQEQVALFQIQQNIRAALHQGMNQEIISQLVFEYQKTQEHHQLNIQGAIQRKLTMIL